MNFLENIYHKSLIENEKQLRFWEDYLQRLTSLDLNVFADKLKVPVLVPIGNRVLFRGEIQHTNEVTVALGADYFAKCSVKQAEVLRQRRITDAKSKLESFTKEREYLENQLSFGKRHTFEEQGQDIIEHYTEEEDKIWRDTHRENMRAYKQRKAKDEDRTDISDEELWNRLEELELQEEINNEQNLVEDSQSMDIVPDNNEPYILEETEEIDKIPVEKMTDEKPRSKTMPIVKKKVTFTDIEEDRNSQICSKLDLLQKVMEKQQDIERQLQELKAKERGQSLTENDLIAKLDEMEQLDELEDEMERLEDVLENGAGSSGDSSDNDNHDTTESTAVAPNKGIKFADEMASDDDPETLDITFKHSDNEPNLEPYDYNKGIQKPSDVYQAYSHLFKETKSILKKSKYGPDDSTEQIYKEPCRKKNSVILEEEEFPEENRTIVVKDVLESVNISKNVKLEESKARPTSLFKAKRQMQKKS